MKEKILIINDLNSNTDYRELNRFFEIFLVQNEIIEESYSDFKLIIIDLKEPNKLLENANKIRDQVPHMPLLLIVDYKYHSMTYFFKNISGFGQVKILYSLRKIFFDELYKNIQFLLHPEYPIKESDIAIIIPVYNEETRFHNVIEFIENLKKLINYGFTNTSIYFINDGSTDNTNKLIDVLYKEKMEELDYVFQKSYISYHSIEINTKKAGTYIEALMNINSEFMVFVDGDNSFRIEDIAMMINIIRNEYFDMVVGSKDKTSENRRLSRTIFSFFKRILIHPLLPKGINDSQTGLKVLSKRAARHILPYLHVEFGFALDLEMLYLAKKMKFRVIQTSVDCIDREGSHINLVSDSIDFLKSLFKIVKYNKKIDIS